MLKDYDKVKKLLQFYEEMVRTSQNRLDSLSNFFEQAFMLMIMSHEYEKEAIRSEAFILLFMLNLSSNNGYRLEYPLSIVDDRREYINRILNDSELMKQILIYIHLFNDEKKWDLLKEDKDGIVKMYREIEKLRSIFRNGWIKRNIPINWYESDSVHSSQMFGLAVAYWMLFEPHDLDFKEVIEMILIHEVGEIIVGDITELDKNHSMKHEYEKNAVIKIFSNLKNGEYFINLWLSFEKRKSNEARFVYELDKLDPIIKAKYYDNVLGRNDLLDDFYQYEENRGTFNEGRLEDTFKYLKKG